MSRRSFWMTFGASIILSVALSFVAINGRLSRANDLNGIAASVLGQSRNIRENISQIGADESALLDALTPATLTPADLVDVVQSIASPLELRMTDITLQAAPISREDALLAIKLDPSTFPEYFSVVTASVQLTGDVPRLMQLLENLKGAFANGPLRGLVQVKVAFDDINSTLSVGLVGVSFNGASTTPATSIPVGAPTSTTLLADAILPVDTTVVP